MAKMGGMCGRLACMAGVMRGRGEGMHGRRIGHYSGQYASFWNAFLVAIKIDENIMCNCANRSQ